jgi:hypothetical protein
MEDHTPLLEYCSTTYECKAASKGAPWSIEYTSRLACLESHSKPITIFEEIDVALGQIQQPLFVGVGVRLERPFRLGPALSIAKSQTPIGCRIFIILVW